MEINTSTETGRVPITIVQVSGNLDSSTYDAFQKGVNELIDNGAHYILLDLAKTEFISSAGFRTFNNIFNKLRSLHPETNLSNEEMKKGISAGTYKSPHLKLLNLSENSKTAFELAGFDLFIETFSDKQTALASF